MEQMLGVRLLLTFHACYAVAVQAGVCLCSRHGVFRHDMLSHCVFRHMQACESGAADDKLSVSSGMKPKELMLGHEW